LDGDERFAFVDWCGGDGCRKIRTISEVCNLPLINRRGVNYLISGSCPWSVEDNDIDFVAQ